MPFNGSGTFNRVHNWQSDAANSIPITDTRMDAEDDGFAAGLSNCMTRDGQSPATASIPMGGNRITGLANGAALTDAATVGQLQNGAVHWGGTSGGAATAQTIAPTPAATAYAAGQTFKFISGYDAGAGMTLNVSSLGAKTVTIRQGAVAAGDFAAGDLLTVTYDGTAFHLVGVAIPAFGKVAVSGESDVVADGIKDTLTLAAGNGIAITTTPASDTVTIAGATNYQEFTSSGTWTKPAGITFGLAECWGGGGAGGSGRRGAAGTDRSGGGGGSGGSYTYRLLIASALSATEAVSIGAGGTGGAAVTTNDTNGNAGTDGGTTSFGAHLAAYGGQGGLGGTNTAGNGVKGAGVLSSVGAPTSGGSGNAGQFGDGATSTSPVPSGFGGGSGGARNIGSVGGGGGSSFAGGPGGGAGGSISSSNVSYNGGAGGTNAGTGGTASNGGTTPGGAGGNGSGRVGGGGGAAGGGAGGSGGDFGAGGGGGAANVNGNNSGAGGDGGDGRCRVYSW
ncbi:hypothetical protein JN531_001315 [Flagellatimonas centrodinii]|uniref:hypothetical protein n=1 Tax=Flagellatimonas centrodinii TaxID=2806210 RepID=UPI001FEFF2C0|nr:hypothetical protein [Flagellatimonas centrodinii]ULQ46937.1 hypothetical protein JN531_001315 [Flagellatimonas centrodinii]